MGEPVISAASTIHTRALVALGLAGVLLGIVARPAAAQGCDATLMYRPYTLTMIGTPVGGGTFTGAVQHKRCGAEEWNVIPYGVVASGVTYMGNYTSFPCADLKGGAGLLFCPGQWQGGVITGTQDANGCWQHSGSFQETLPPCYEPPGLRSCRTPCPGQLDSL